MFKEISKIVGVSNDGKNEYFLVEYRDRTL